MAQEIERRFLLSGFPDFISNDYIAKIDQGYFELSSAADSLDSFRVRIFNNSTAVLTLKEGKGISREELEANLDLAIAKRLFNKCQHRLSKLRIRCQGWEIDVFGDVLHGVIFAEKELKREDEPINIPKWLEPYIIREVTDSLTNLHLARLASDLKGLNLSASYYLDRQMRKIEKYVLTGPPCSGKSTVLEQLKKEYPNYHFVPEVASIIIGQLGIFPGEDPLSQKRFQSTIYRTQKLFEATSVKFAISNDKKGIIFDRGALDGAAYVPGGMKEFERIVGTDQEEEFKYYNKVIYMSVPPKDIYELKKTNNPARKETYQQACELGEKIHRVWKSHPSFHEADDRNWDEKVKKVRDILNLELP